LKRSSCNALINDTSELIKWKNYGLKQNTWEPIENLSNCTKILEAFRALRDPVDTASTFFLPFMQPRLLANAFLSPIFLQ
jgi:hypothetical protein